MLSLLVLLLLMSAFAAAAVRFGAESRPFWDERRVRDCAASARPPAMAGRITRVSASPTAVPRPSRTRTSSSLR